MRLLFRLVQIADLLSSNGTNGTRREIHCRTDASRWFAVNHSCSHHLRTPPRSKELVCNYKPSSTAQQRRREAFLALRHRDSRHRKTISPSQSTKRACSRFQLWSVDG